MKTPMNPEGFVPLGVYRPRFLLFYMSKTAEQLHVYIQLYFNRNLNQGILSPVWWTYGLGVILDTKQLQNANEA